MCCHNSALRGTLSPTGRQTQGVTVASRGPEGTGGDGLTSPHHAFRNVRGRRAPAAAVALIAWEKEGIHGSLIGRKHLSMLLREMVNDLI